MTEKDAGPEQPTPFRRPEDTPTLLVHDDGPAERAAPQLAPGTILGERYRIVAPLGSGGMGEVYRADDLRLGQTVALKFVSRARPHLDRRLFDEVRIGREIAHPNVCRLYDIVEMDGHIFISMEFISGEDLASLLRRVGRLPADRAITVARQICAGIAAAHDKGVIHRDLKPGNVMIDGRGRAHITDFGLAVFEESSAQHVTAGTPAYMAPEQLQGKPASVQSDLYAVGLVLYELFTGRRAFEARSTRELVAKQQAADFERPSIAVKDLPAAVERVILRCLDPDPLSRPDSAETILQELPGRDALTAAIAAGETPSPEMVAAASARGNLDPRVAWAMLFVVVAGLIAAEVFSRSSTLYRSVPEIKPPQVLEDKARAILAVVAPQISRADSSSMYFEAEDPDAIYFLYRQSPKFLRPRNMERRVMHNDPPLSVPGMASVTLTADGRPRELVIVPPAVRKARSAAAGAPWPALLAEAGFDEKALAAVTPSRTAPADSDEKRAWIDHGRGQRIEAASYQGQPVWFSVTEEGGPAGDGSGSAAQMQSIAFRMMVAFLIVLPIAGILLAWRNVARKRGDFRGAFRVALALLAFVLTGMMMRAHHTFGDVILEWWTLSNLTATYTFWALVSLILYIAVEPLVRRRWPHMLISWMRLLDGRFRDPTIGRDLLAGAVAGVIVIALWHGTALMSGAKPIQLTTFPRATGPMAFGGALAVPSTILLAIFEAMMRGIGGVTFLIVLRGLLRNERLTNVVAVVLLAISFLGDASGPLAVRAIYALICGVVVVGLLRRFGLLALVSAATFIVTLWRVPLTLDPAAWYFTGSALALLFLAAIAVYGFVISTAGRPRLPRLAFDA
ncbi:MAG TPA: serine/threonine-protein kinase [Thermoanaerobaculia bacterium]|nr:serine/threonine-protein kinase [Thermoanaerobaculia bacterium]